MNENGRLLLNKIRNEFVWYKQVNRIENKTLAVFENLDAVAKTYHLMRYVEEKINHIRNNRDLVH